MAMKTMILMMTVKEMITLHRGATSALGMGIVLMSGENGIDVIRHSICAIHVTVVIPTMVGMGVSPVGHEAHHRHGFHRGNIYGDGFPEEDDNVPVLAW